MAGAVLGGPSDAQGESRNTRPEDLAQWKQALLGPSSPRVYDSGTHVDARMHLGGIGTGNFEIGADGQLTTWQLFNTLRDGEVPFYFLARAGKATRLLQTRGGPDWPRIKQISMTGEYPIATLRYTDPELPVKIELDAFSPFAPLDTRLSSIPAAVFVFRIHNPTARAEEVALAALLTNPVGYDAAVAIEGLEHPNFGGNVNQVFHELGATGLVLKAEPGDGPSINGKATIATLPNLKGMAAPPQDWPEGLHVTLLAQPPKSDLKFDDPAHSVIWLEEAPADLSAQWLRQVRTAVTAGATLVFSGRSMPLIKSYAAVSGGKPLTPGAVPTRHHLRRFRERLRELAGGGNGVRASSGGGHAPRPAARQRLRRQGPGELVLRGR